MKKTYHAFTLTLSIFIFSFSAFAKSDSEIKLESVPGSKQKQGTIQQVLKGTMDEVWATVMDIEHYGEFMPNNKKTTILENQPDHVRYHAYLDMPWPIADVEYDCDVFPKLDQKRIEFNLVEGTGKGVKSFYGHWEFQPQSTNEIQATYVLMFESDRYYPQWATNLGLKSTLGKVIKNVQKRIDKQYKK